MEDAGCSVDVATDVAVTDVDGEREGRGRDGDCEVDRLAVALTCEGLVGAWEFGWEVKGGRHCG